MSFETEYFVGVDVGSGSVRAALVNKMGRIEKNSFREIKTWKPCADNYEQSSEDIWRSCVQVIRDVINKHNPDDIKGLGFDATCSLVVLDGDGKPLSVNTSSINDQNIIMWMDHRAYAEAELINKTNHPILQYVGGKVSLEMEMPKILWMKRNLHKTWSKVGYLFDLPDFLTWKATGSFSRSLCSLVCKWNYERSVSEKVGWNTDFLQQIGLEDLTENNFVKIGNVVLCPGEPCGTGLTSQAASELGLKAGTPVATSIIDAHAGGLGMIGTYSEGVSKDKSSRLSLICGTSTCHMAVNSDAVIVPGIWGPYFSAMVPNMWLNEAGQSASGMLLDHIINNHPAGIRLAKVMKTGELREHLRKTLHKLAKEQSLEDVNLLTESLHMWPDFHGNRSPLADPTMRGALVGLSLGNNDEDLAVLYLATLQALAYGTRHIIDSLVARGYQAFESLLICGGLSQDPLFVQIQADAIGLPVLRPREKESVLVGSAILGACASRHFPTIDEAISEMGGTADAIQPRRAIKAFHDKKYKVFLKMYKDQLEYRNIMSSEEHSEIK